MKGIFLSLLATFVPQKIFSNTAVSDAECLTKHESDQSEYKVLKLHKKNGEKVTRGDLIVEFEGDKILLEFVASQTGYVCFHKELAEGQKLQTEKNLCVDSIFTISQKQGDCLKDSS